MTNKSKYHTNLQLSFVSVEQRSHRSFIAHGLLPLFQSIMHHRESVRTLATHSLQPGLLNLHALEQMLPECHILWHSAFFWQRQVMVVLVPVLDKIVAHGMEAIVRHVHVLLELECCCPAEEGHTSDLGIFLKSN
jgi:hypothetical protein